MVEIGQTEIVGNNQVPDGVQMARDSLASLHPGDAGYLSRLDALVGELMSRFARSGNPDDLDEAITRTRQILNLTPPGHPHHLGALSNVGQILLKRFKFRGEASDLTQAITFLESAVEACTPEQSSYIPLVANLCSGLLNHYSRYGDVADLDRIIEKSSFALSSCSADSPNRDALFNNWATALKQRFEKQGNRSDLDTALTHYQSCLDLRPPGHPLRHTVLGNFADALLFRFEVDGHLQDLESAADHFASALQLRSPGQQGFLFYLMSLGIVYVRFYGVQGDREKLEMAIKCYQTAMEHSTVPNLDHSRLLDNYGAALRFRYSLFGDVNDLDQAIRHLTMSSEITPQTYSGRPLTLFNLAVTLLDRFHATNNVADLDSCIEKFTFALQSSGQGHHERPAMLSMYARALLARFKAKGNTQDLEFATSISREVLASMSPTGLNYSSIIGNASAILHDYFFYKSGNVEDVQSIIDHCDRALLSISPTEPTVVILKAIRANALFRKSLIGREEAGINMSIDAFREIIAVLPEGHGDYVAVHLNFGLALHMRFQLATDAKDLDEAIAVYRVAQRHCTRDHTNYVVLCAGLGNALRSCFDYYRDTGGALDEAIVLLAEAEDILSSAPEHAEYKGCLSNLGSALFMRYQAQRNREDLDAAVERLSRALTLPGSAEYLIPYILATTLSARYNEYQNLDDLERSVELFSAAEKQIPPEHRSRGTLCQNYGHTLFKLANHQDPLQHIDAAISFYKEALQCLPPSHHDRPLTLMHLAEAQHKRALLRLDEGGLYVATKLIQDTVRSLPDHNPLFHGVCHSAAGLFMTTWKVVNSQPQSLMDTAFEYYEKAATYTYHRSFKSVGVALEWASIAEDQNHSSALLAYQTCLGSLNRHLLSTASVKKRRAVLLEKHWVKRTGTLATDAAGCAIAQGKLELAVELSEQGRGLLWSQIAQSRTPLDALRSAGDTGRGLASDFERVGSMLAQSALARPDIFVTTSRLATEEAARRYRQLAKELDDIVVRIRQLDGFQFFLDRASFQSLQRATLGGPVILVNASRRRCDALIVRHDAPPQLVPLPNTTLEDLTTISTDLYHMLKTTSRVGEEKIRERELVILLRTLWDTVVSPIVDELTGFLPRGARIWWCPTSKLTSLPLHAAGAYRKDTRNLANMYVSSYTPTLTALIRARYQPSLPVTVRMPPAFVAISQAKPSSSTSPELRTADTELALIQSLLPPSVPFSALSSDTSTGDAVLTALSTHAWAHLACHGRPNAEQPFDSSFALSDRAVTILDIIGGRHVHDAGVGSDPNASASIPEFVFLSACHTAVGDENAPDEIIHLAAAVQFAGFRSVIGTMWAVDDGMVREMVKAFYTHMFSGGALEGQGWDYTEAAKALNKASKSVNKSVVSLDQRIVFIHIGA